MSSTYYIYRHISPSGKVYVGQTINIQKRWGYNGEHYLKKKKDGSFVQNIFARALLKYGWENFKHEILLEEIPKSEADYAEKYLIRWYKIHNLSYNISDGGEGNCGARKPLSEERKRQITEFMRTNHPMKGKHHSSEAMAKIIYANRHRVYTEEQKERMHETGKRLGQMVVTEERRKKYSDYRKAHPDTWVAGWNRKEVHQYSLEGKYITSYSSAEEAARAIKRSSSGDIGKCIKGECASALGFIWTSEKMEYIDVSKFKVVKTNHGARLIDMTEDGKRKRRDSHGKPVNQYTIDGIYIRTFHSITDAKEFLQYRGGGIGKCCNHLDKYKTAGGYKWEYDTVENRKNLELVA